MENIEDIIGKNIRARRLRLGLTQEDLAELAGMHPVTLNKIENSGRGSSRKAIAKLAAALKCSVEELHSSRALHESARSVTTRAALIERLLSLIPTLTDAQIGILLEIAETPAVSSDEDEMTIGSNRKA